MPSRVAGLSAGAMVLALTVATLFATTASAQLFQGSTPTRVCEGEEGDELETCTNDDQCTSGSCSDTLAVEAYEPTLDNPDIYQLAHIFRDTENATTAYAFFDLSGLDFAAGRAQQSSGIPSRSTTQARTTIQALFEWITGPPEKVKQRSDLNNVKQKTYTAVRLVFTAIVDARPEIPGGDEVIELYAYGTCADEPCDEDEELLYPLETEDCDGRKKVDASEPSTPEVDLDDVTLTAKWRLDCDNLPIPDTRDICPLFTAVGTCDGGVNDGESCDSNGDCEGASCFFVLEEDCMEEDLVSAQDLLEAFEGERDSVKARGNGEADYCDDWVDTELPEDCETSTPDDDDDDDDVDA